MKVPVTAVGAHGEITSKPIQLEAACEFINHIQISLDGIKFFRLDSDLNGGSLSSE